MADLPAAIAAAREALHEHDAYGMPIDAGTIRDLLAALDAAQGEAVAWRYKVNGKWYVSENAPSAVFGWNEVEEHAALYLAPQAPPAAVKEFAGFGAFGEPVYRQAPPAAPRVERYGDGVLVHWPEGVEQYVQVGDCVTGNIAAPPAAVVKPKVNVGALAVVGSDKAMLHAAIVAAAAVKAPPAAVPAGYALVPVEPTKEAS